MAIFKLINAPSVTAVSSILRCGSSGKRGGEHYTAKTARIDLGGAPNI
jgi:hypothetical protein